MQDMLISSFEPTHPLDQDAQSSEDVWVTNVYVIDV